ncbi:hypothetical protein ABIB40_000667 [Pedobacter sp. UYP30]|uniref:hypothetical protein n=1 Tax=Pedobacter sp. UYP30 TaxID=1756400 RepID=UPI0033978EB2
MSATILFNSKEEIRNRMLKNALDFWGSTNVNDLDPFVKIIVEALSTEIFNVSNDVKNLENRVLNKISRILASDYLTNSLPAHAILTGKPHESTENLKTINHFFYRKAKAKNAKEKDGKTDDAFDVYFTPVGEAKLFNADIRYFFYDNQLIEYDKSGHKMPVANAISANSKREAFIGIQCHGDLTDLRDLSLFFEWPGYTNNEDFYKLLAVLKCHAGEDELEIATGLGYQENRKAKKRPVFYEQNVINRITDDIKNFYDNRFISLTDERLKDIGNYADLPASFKEHFAAEDLKAIKPCFWLKLTFPTTITSQTIAELDISLNCFPVLNRKLFENKLRLKDINNIVPVRPPDNEYFLSVNDLRDDLNIVYNEVIYSESNKSYEGSYSIRNGGAERFDQRNARQLIEYLFELIRDEKAAFSTYGSDFLNSILTSMEQNLALVEKRTANTLLSNELLNYIIVKPEDKATMLYVKYWTTLAADANHIRKGSKLQQFENVKLQPESLRLLSTTLGGRNTLNASERIQAYKYGLTTKDRIVTQADLTSFCFYELGGKIQDVKVQKGVAISNNPKEGLKKTIDIYFKPSAGMALSTTEWDTLLDLLRSKLEHRSIMNSNYRLFLGI